MSPHRLQMQTLHYILDAIHESGYDMAQMAWSFTNSDFSVCIHVDRTADDILAQRIMEILGVQQVEYHQLHEREAVVYVVLDEWKGVQ